MNLAHLHEQPGRRGREGGRGVTGAKSLVTAKPSSYHYYLRVLTFLANWKKSLHNSLLAVWDAT